MECGCHASDASSNYTNKDGYGDDNDCGDDEGDNDDGDDNDDNDYGDDNGDHGDGDDNGDDNACVRDRIGSLQSLLMESRVLTARFSI